MPPTGNQPPHPITEEWNGSTQLSTMPAAGQTPRQFGAAHLAALRVKLDLNLPQGAPEDMIVHGHFSAGELYPVETVRGSKSPQQWADVHYGAVASSLAQNYPDVG